MIRLVSMWLTLLIFLSGPALEGNVRFSDFTIAAETTAGVVPTREGLITISEHLSSLDADPANAIMYRRLTDAFEAGKPLTGVDAKFYTHELTESGLMDSGLDWQAAHAQTLQLQGIPYVSGYTAQLYTSEALRASEAFDLQLYLEATKWKP